MRTRALVRFVGVAVLLLWMFSLPARGLTASETDPDDVALRLDIKTATHANDSTNITYTVETYESFPDNFADFRWGIDKDGDQDFDYFVSVEYDKKLTGRVEDAAEEEIAGATTSRPSPNSLRVSFPATALAGLKSYGYSVRALSDLNDNGEADPGEFDLAPNSGLYRHLLEGPAAAPAPAAPAAPPPPAAAPAPAAPPAPAPPAEQTSPRTAAAAPQPAPAAAAPAPAPKAPAPAAGATPPPPAPAAAQAPAMARTGADPARLALMAAGLLILAVPLRSVARRRR